MARLPNQTLLDFKRRLRRFKNTGEGDYSRVLLQVRHKFIDIVMTLLTLDDLHSKDQIKLVAC